VSRLYNGNRRQRCGERVFCLSAHAVASLAAGHMIGARMGFRTFSAKRLRSWPLAQAAVIALEVADRVRGRHEPLIPPSRLLFVGGPHFREIGEEFKSHFVALGGLRPDDRVLDIGCGVGRMAVPLLDYLTSDYEGFDVVPVGIAWCRRNITRCNPNFRFQVANLHNARYSPEGSGNAAAYEFPYPDASFDFALAVSVFTHLLPDALRHYLMQARRVLRPDGTLFATFFLIDERKPTESARFAFDVHGDGYRTIDNANPETAVAYDRREIELLLAEARLTLRSFYPGSWTGLAGTSFQDILVVSR
jgi:SAM-dependent methyltransferase